MKKHIFGIAIFSFIVFAAAFVYGIFSCSEIADVSVPQYVPAERTNCKFRREISESESFSSNVIQAVYSVKTKKITWQGNLSNKENLTYFHFWVVDGKGISYIGSMPSKNVLRGDKIIDSDEPRLNLDKISASANLYLIPDTFKQTPLSEIEYHPKFDKANAIPVTIDYGK